MPGRSFARATNCAGVLKTGDLARQDADGFFYITGRLKRFLKMFGKRFNLDEVEQIVQGRFGFPTACFGRDDLLMVTIEADSENTAAVVAMLGETFGVPKNAVRVEARSRTAAHDSGKIDYQVLTTRNESDLAGVGEGSRDQVSDKVRQ